MIERVFLLKQTDAFREVPTSILQSLAPHLEEVGLDAGEALFRKGDLGHSMYVVVVGRIRVHDGDRTLATLERGAVLGEVSVLASEERMASVTAETEAQLLRLDQEVLYELMGLSPEVSRGLIRVLLERLG
jgi:CRP-like cAMP-binding protein